MLVYCAVLVTIAQSFGFAYFTLLALTLPLKREFLGKSLHEFEMGPEGIFLRKVYIFSYTIIVIYYILL